MLASVCVCMLARVCACALACTCRGVQAKHKQARAQALTNKHVRRHSQGERGGEREKGGERGREGRREGESGGGRDRGQGAEVTWERIVSSLATVYRSSLRSDCSRHA